MAIEASEPKVDDRPSLYIRDDYARELPSDLDVGDSMKFTVQAEVTGISRNKYEDGEESLSYDFRINSMASDGIDEKAILDRRAALGTTTTDTVRKVFSEGPEIVITFKKE